MRVLLLCDDYWHPAAVPTEGIEPLKAKGFEFDIITDGLSFDPDKLKDYPVIMLCKSNQVSQADTTAWMTDAVQKAFIDYVEGGGGLLAIHNATVPSETSAAMSELMGCKFTFHPNNCPVTVAPLRPHPVTDGVLMFTEVDEHYRLEILKDDVDIIMASYSAPQGTESKFEEDPYHNTTAWIGAAGLVRTQGSGKVCVLTPGHLLPVWLNAEFQKTLENALNWCCK
ncbi:MAG: ThuA domain-containing protein [Oscillospiraceae bacterium]|nr:ThuA domain-containing protein [Oscillospiraceae bacterium]